MIPCAKGTFWFIHNKRYSYLLAAAIKLCEFFFLFVSYSGALISVKNDFGVQFRWIVYAATVCLYRGFFFQFSLFHPRRSVFRLC